MRKTLRKDEILRGYDVFSSVVKNGTKFRGGRMLCIAVTTPRPQVEMRPSRPPVRVGFAIGRRRVALAVDRNRIRRLLREIYRTNREDLVAGADAASKNLDIVMMVPELGRGEARHVTFSGLESDWRDVVQQLIRHVGRTG